MGKQRSGDKKPFVQGKTIQHRYTATTRASTLRVSEGGRCEFGMSSNSVGFGARIKVGLNPGCAIHQHCGLRHVI